MHTFSEIKQYHNEISMEAVANPLASLTFKLRNNFKKVAGHFSDIGTLPTDGVPGRGDINIFKLLEQNQEKIRTIGFISFKDLKVPVPPGFKGDVLKLVKVLHRANAINDFVIDRALKPTHDLFLKFIGKPELLTTINAEDFKKIDTFNNEISDIKKELSALFDFKYNYQSQKFVTIYKNLADFQESNKFIANVLYPQYMTNVKSREKLNNYHANVGKSLDLLLLKVEQNPVKYSLNNLTTERISNLVLELAMLIEFVGLMQIYSDQILATSIDTARLVNSYIDFERDGKVGEWMKK